MTDGSCWAFRIHLRLYEGYERMHHRYPSASPDQNLPAQCQPHQAVVMHIFRNKAEAMCKEPSSVGMMKPDWRMSSCGSMDLRDLVVGDRRLGNVEFLAGKAR